MIAEAQVDCALRPWLGDELISRAPELCVSVQQRLNLCVPNANDLERVSQELDSLLYLTVREKTKGSMIVRLADGGSVRVAVADFPVMADDLMYLLFVRYPLDARHLMLLREYSIHASSLSAIRALYTRYTDYETPQELQALARIARSCHPAFRWRAWLDSSQGS